MSSTARLRQVSMVSSVEWEDLASVILERETGQTPSVYTDASTNLSSTSVYLEMDSPAVADLRTRLRTAIQSLELEESFRRTVRIRIRLVKRTDWAESWKRHFRPLLVGGKLLVKPTWSRRIPRTGEAMVLLDPGLCFGTGQHPTTHFCLQQVVALRNHSSQSLLDLGCGSGILALAAVRLGYQPVDAVDNDPGAIRIAEENAALNGLETRVNFSVQELANIPMDLARRYDVVCANLIYDILMEERKRVVSQVKPDGALVLAGILTTQFEAVVGAYLELGWIRDALDTNGDWTSGVFRRGPLARSLPGTLVKAPRKAKPIHARPGI